MSVPSLNPRACVASCVMRHQSPSIVPRQANQDTYLVLDDFGGRLGRAG